MINKYNVINEIIDELHKTKYKVISAINLSNCILELLDPNKKFKINSPEEVYKNKCIPKKTFKNDKVESWFQKYPLAEGERCAFNLFDDEKAPYEANFYFLNENVTKAVVSAAVRLSDNWEDSNSTQNKNYKVGIDFFLPPDAKSLLMVVSKNFKLRVLEFSEKLSNTQIDILEKISKIGNSYDSSRDDDSAQKIIHDNLWCALELKEVNKKFYQGIAALFNSLVNHLVTNDKRDEKLAKSFVNRLIGRLLFVWFLRKLGKINPEIGYFNIDSLNSTEYYETRLKPLFFNVLNKEPKSFERKKICGVIDTTTPYLNGGLFEAHEDDWADELINFPDDWFKEVYHHFDEYNFTTDESTPEYEQVAIDPEMLGRVFENLLHVLVDDEGDEQRRKTGSYYTPREIVDYMCKESIRQFLYSKISKSNHEKIDKLIDTDDSKWKINHSNSIREVRDIKKEVLDLLDNMKIIDPACGSGAFPIGMMQTLLKIYERLDARFDPYKIKRNILKNNIYGVDIQPMAVEISKLRAWLSLEIENKEDEALPNLNFKFVCANTLVPLSDNIEESSGTLNLFDGEDNKHKATLANVRDKFFEACTPANKESAKKEYYNLRDEICFNTKKGEQIKKWDPFDLNKSCEFFNSYEMFSVLSFDICIGNPPYVPLQKMKSLSDKLYKPLGYHSYDSSGDLYSLFYERGVDLLKDEGILCYITSNKWMRAKYGSKLRNYFIDNMNCKLLLDFGGTKVFSATVDTNILLAQKEKQSEDFSCVEYKNNSIDNLSDYVKQHSFKTRFSKNEIWVSLTDIERSIKRKIEEKGVPLKDWDISINYGIKTGCNEAFIIDGHTREQLIKEDPKSEEIIRPNKLSYPEFQTIYY